MILLVPYLAASLLYLACLPEPENWLEAAVYASWALCWPTGMVLLLLQEG